MKSGIVLLCVKTHIGQNTGKTASCRWIGVVGKGGGVENGVEEEVLTDCSDDAVARGGKTWVCSVCALTKIATNFRADSGRRRRTLGNAPNAYHRAPRLKMTVYRDS